MAVREAESHQVGESGRGLALGCYFQLQGTGAELTAKAFVHPARGRRRVCVCGGWVVVARGGEGGGARESRREGGEWEGDETLAPAPGFDVETEH